MKGAAGARPVFATRPRRQEGGRRPESRWRSQLQMWSSVCLAADDCVKGQESVAWNRRSQGFHIAGRLFPMNGCHQYFLDRRV